MADTLRTTREPVSQNRHTRAQVAAIVALRDDVLPHFPAPRITDADRAQAACDVAKNRLAVRDFPGAVCALHLAIQLAERANG